MQALFELPCMDFLRFAQGLLGAPSSKPTHLLLLGLPQFLSILHAHRLQRELPRASTIGSDTNGMWKTAVLKEYPPAFCRSIAHAMYQELSSPPVDSAVSDPPEEFLSTCKAMSANEYGQFTETLLGRSIALPCA